jgi:S-adenosylmethionine-dependent methyltransferase
MQPIDDDLEIWSVNSSLLAEAYIRNSGNLRFEIVTRSLRSVIPNTSCEVIDVGGGYGMQARMLCDDGHRVTIVDIDEIMLRHAKSILGDRLSRVRLMHCSAGHAAAVFGPCFDLVCSHSVLMYQVDLRQALHDLVELAKPGGWLSILSLNPSAEAMRSGLQGRWSEAVALLSGSDSGAQQGNYLQTIDHKLDDIVRVLGQLGISVIRWEGIGVFTDHLTTSLLVDDPEEVYRAEMLAGQRDPYRQVARCFHIIARKLM